MKVGDCMKMKVKVTVKVTVKRTVEIHRRKVVR